MKIQRLHLNMEPLEEVPVLRGIDAEDWNNVFQFRRHHSMRHCFARWTYRNIVSGIAHTWDVSQDDVMRFMICLFTRTSVTTSQPVIVQTWGDDLPAEVGVSVLVDLELPAFLRVTCARDVFQNFRRLLPDRKYSKFRRQTDCGKSGMIDVVW